MPATVLSTSGSKVDSPDQFVKAISNKNGVLILLRKKNTDELIACFTRAKMSFKSGSKS